MRKPTPKLGDIVAINFLDHVEGSDRAERYLVYGRIAVITKQTLTVDSWALHDPTADREADRENIHTFTILRRVIDEIEILRRAGDG